MDADRKSLVEGMYKDVLGRDADAAGLDFWSNTDLGKNDLWRAFFNSQEAATPRVEDMYRTVLGRRPDDPGVAFWSGLGIDQDALLKAFYNSPEAAKRYAPPREQEDVYRPNYLYEGNNFYGRAPRAEWMQAGRSAVEGINRMPGVFSDYGAIANMPGAMIQKTFYPSGKYPFSTDKEETADTSSSTTSDYDNLAAMFGALSEPEKQNLLAILLSAQGSGE